MNYELLEKCYGITFEEVVNLAPLLVVKAAEESLVQQEELIDNDEGKLGTAWKLQETLGKTADLTQT